ncbi:MAG: flagellar hook-length control protein FliK [Armatimonadota bacterium]
MVDAISVIAPQSVGAENVVQQGSDKTAQDGPQFAEVLNTTMKDEQQTPTQTQEAQAQVDEPAGTKVAEVVKLPGEQVDAKDALLTAEGLAAQMMAVVNIQTTTMPLVQDAVETAVEDLQVETPNMETVGNAKGSEAIPLQMLTQTPAPTPEAEAVSAESVTAAVVNGLSNDTATVAPKQEATVPAESKTDTKEPLATEHADQPLVTKASGQRLGTTAKGTEVGSSIKSDTNPQSKNVVSPQATEVVNTPQDVHEAQRSNSENKASASSPQTRIEVTASAEPPREFTIKPQVLNPVTSQAKAADSLISGAVSQVASTENGGVKSETSGSQTNGQAGAFAGQVTLDTSVRQTAEVKATPKIEQPVHQQVIDQIVREVRMIKLPQRTDLVVQLTPPELGTLRVRISQAEQGMTAQIQTSGEQVKGLLQANLPALNQALSDAGLKMDSVSVTSSSSFGSLMQDTTHGSAQQQQSGRRNTNSGYQAVSGVQTMVGMSGGISGAGDSQGYSWLA